MNNIFSYIAPILFFLIPLFLGRGIVRTFYKQKLNYAAVSYFIVGSLASYLFILVGFYAIVKPFFNEVSYQQIFQMNLVVLLITGIILNFKHRRFTIHKKQVLPVIGVGLISMIAYSIWQLYSPYPFNWDVYEHQTLVNTMLSNHFSFFTSRVTDTFGFDGYSSLFHTLMSLSQSIVSIEIMKYWSTISFIHLFLFATAAYFFSYEITRNKYIGFISALLSAFVFDSTISFTSFFFIPQTFTTVVFMFLFVQLFSEAKSGRLPPVFIIVVSSIFLFLNHYIVGTLAVCMYISFYLYLLYFERLKDGIQKKHIVIGIIVFMIFLCFSFFVPLGFINKGEAAAFNLSLTEKITFIRQSYGYLFIFLPIGMYMIVKRKKLGEITALVLALIFLAIQLLHVPYVTKFYTIGRMFIDFVIAFGIYTILKQIKNSGLLAGAIFFLVVTLIAILSANAMYWKQYLFEKTIQTQVAPAELEAAAFLKQNYSGKNVLLVSDPATQHILEPFSKVNTQGGAYANVETRKVLNTIGNGPLSNVMDQDLMKIKDRIEPKPSKILLATSGRYFLWQKLTDKDKESLSVNIWYPANLTLEDREKIQEYLKNPVLKPLFQNDAMVIFEIK